MKSFRKKLYSSFSARGSTSRCETRASDNKPLVLGRHATGHQHAPRCAPPGSSFFPSSSTPGRRSAHALSASFVWFLSLSRSHGAVNNALSTEDFYILGSSDAPFFSYRLFLYFLR